MDEVVDEVVGIIERHGDVVSVFLIVLTTLLVRYIAKLALDRLAAKAERTANFYDDALLQSARRPVLGLILIVGLAEAATRAGAELVPLEEVETLRTVGVLAMLTWFAMQFAGRLEGHLSDPVRRKQPIDATTAQAIGKLLRASVVITFALLMLQTFGVPIAGVLAFGGVGGIAVGFAAKDTLANFFGALMVFFDRPFSVGNWIRSPDRDIEGTVEEIGWRLTRIRTFDQRPLYVPNATFSTIAVENPSRMRNRRIFETIGVRYSDVDVLPNILEDVRVLLREHPAIDTNRLLMVNFNAFGASSLDFFVYTFTKTVVWTEFHGIKEELLLRISEIITRHGAEIAFPTRTLHLVEPEPEPPSRGAT